MQRHACRPQLYCVQMAHNRGVALHSADQVGTVLRSSVHALHAQCDQTQQRVIPEVHMLEDAAGQYSDGGAERAIDELPHLDVA